MNRPFRLQRAMKVRQLLREHGQTKTRRVFWATFLSRRI